MGIDTEASCPVCSAPVVELRLNLVEKDEETLWVTNGRFSCGLIVGDNGVTTSCVNATQMILDLRKEQNEPNTKATESSPQA